MARYQIRTPENQVIEDIIDFMAEKSWEILKAWEVFRSEPEEKEYKRFYTAIYEHTVPFVKAYKLCGLSNVCIDELKATSWAPPAHVLDATPKDLVYHLFPGKDAEQFLDHLSHAVWEAILPILKPSLLEEVRSILKTSFRTILGQYMYFNPVCGKTELCVYSSSSPQKVWGRSR